MIEIIRIKKEERRSMFTDILKMGKDVGIVKSVLPRVKSMDEEKIIPTIDPKIAKKLEE